MHIAMHMLLTGLLSAILLFVVHSFLKFYSWKRRADKMTENIPGPKPMPIIGSAHLVANISNLYEMFEGLKEEVLEPYGASRGQIIKVWLGPKLLIFLSDPKHVETVLSSRLANDKDDIYQVMKVVTNGFFVRNGHEWQELRKPLNKILSTKMIESRLTLFHENSLKFCKLIDNLRKDYEKFNLRAAGFNYSMDSLSVIFFGHEFNELEKNKYNLAQLADELVNLMLLLVVKPQYNLFPSITKYTPDGRHLIKKVRKIWEAIQDMLSTRREERKHSKAEGSYAPKYFADVILDIAEENQLSKDETAKLATDFVTAGVDTSAIIFCYTLLMLAMHPEHQEAVYKEQLDIMGSDYKVQPSWEDLSKMAYLTRVIKEVLRLYSPPGILRKLNGDLQFDEYTLPEGSTIYVVLYSLHRNKRYWTYPDKFHPDHFLPEEMAKRPKLSSIPFSWGPRDCPGYKYAMVSMKMLLSTTLRRYKFSTDLKYENLKYRFTFIPQPIGGFMLSATPRIENGI